MATAALVAGVASLYGRVDQLEKDMTAVKVENARLIERIGAVNETLKRIEEKLP